MPAYTLGPASVVGALLRGATTYDYVRAVEATAVILSRTGSADGPTAVTLESVVLAENLAPPLLALCTATDRARAIERDGDEDTAALIRAGVVAVCLAMDHDAHQEDNAP